MSRRLMFILLRIIAVSYYQVFIMWHERAYNILMEQEKSRVIIGPCFLRKYQLFFMLFYLRITHLQPSRLLSCRNPVLQDKLGSKSSARPLLETLQGLRCPQANTHGKTPKGLSGISLQRCLRKIPRGMPGRDRRMGSLCLPVY